MRPRSLDELVGQGRLVGAGTPLRGLVEGHANLSVILWGPPGTGKTTIAYLVSKATGRRFKEISAVSAGVKDVREAVEEAKLHLRDGTETVLFVDEVHRFSKSQQDALLPAVENRWVSLIAATTENPSFSVVGPLLSRSLLLTLDPLGPDALEEMVQRALTDERGLAGQVTIDDTALDGLIRLADGDGRKALTLLEAAAASAIGQSLETITVEVLESAIDRAAVRYDKDGDQHYDITSAYVKSLRGGDVDAALHYLARMIEAGEDPRYIARRLMVLASEDVGMADPTALTSAVNASTVVERVGLPEARIALAQATIHICLAPKSNATIMAIDTALADVRAGRIGPVPKHLRDAHYKGAKKLGHGKGYQYPHDHPGGVARQQYAPDSVADREYYQPKDAGMERSAGERLNWLRKRLGRRQ